MDFKIIIIFIIVQSTSSCAAGASQLTCPNETVSAVEGENVTVRVSMDPQSDMTDDRVNIKRADLDVFVYIYHRNPYFNDELQAAQYKNRTSLSEEDLIRGVLDLEIRNLTLNDSGSYQVFSSKHEIDCTFNISVAAKVNSWDGAEGHSQTEPLWKTVLLVLTVLTVIIIIVAVVLIYLCRSEIRRAWPRVRGRVCRLLSGRSQGQDPDPEVKFQPVQSDDTDPQNLLSSV